MNPVIDTRPPEPPPQADYPPTQTSAGGPAARVQELVESLETHLGDPFAADSRITFRRVIELDEKEGYPHDELAALHSWNAHEYAVPARWGGRAVNIETGLHLMRQIARRDPTAAAALSLTSLCYMTIWVAGTDEQRVYYGDLVRNGAKLAYALSERDFGSDILASGTVARKVPGGYRVSGEKWLIGNCTVADFLLLFVRTGSRPGPAAFSLLLLDKRSAPAGSIEALPDEPLHGLRGLDLSGVRLHDVFVPDSARIGAEGRGVEIVLQGAHSVRSIISAIPLGCTDTGLRLALDFAVNRRVFGSAVAEIPYSRRQLVQAYADLLTGDAVASVATRSLQVCPEQSSVFSAVAKYWVPTRLEATMSQLAVVIGARHYLRSDPRFGVFQKLARDLPVSGFADGNTVVNLKNVAAQLGQLLGPTGGGFPGGSGPAEVLFNLDAELPDYEPWRQSLSARGRDTAVGALADTADRLRCRGQADGGEAGWVAAADLLERIGGERARLAGELATLKDQYGAKHAESEELFALARQYCTIHAAACVAGIWAHSSPVLPAGDRPELLLACLERLYETFAPQHRALDRAGIDLVAEVMLGQHGRGESFSIRPAALAAVPLDHLTETADIRPVGGPQAPSRPFEPVTGGAA